MLYMDDMQAALIAHSLSMDQTAGVMLMSVVLSLLMGAGYDMIGLYPRSMVVLWAAVGLIELNIAALLGGWVYREGGTTAA